LTTQIKENTGDQTVLLLGRCHELPERERQREGEGERERNCLNRHWSLCSLMQKWTSANAD